jgi:hypothetical protein
MKPGRNEQSLFCQFIVNVLFNFEFRFIDMGMEFELDIGSRDD